MIILVEVILFTQTNMYERFIATLIQYMILIMISNNQSNDINNSNNDIDIDTEIVNCISIKGYISRRDMTKYLIESHKDENGKSERGYTKPSIDRKIAKLEKLEIILIIKPHEFKKFGIDESDNRVSYLVLKQSIERYEYFDSLLEHINSDDEIIQKMALKEIESYQQDQFLSGKQIDFLVNKLTIANDEIRDRLLKIIYFNIHEKGIKPLNEDSFLERLRLLLKDYPDIPKGYPTIRINIISLLGCYNDKTVVDQLIDDARNIEDLSNVKKDYLKKECSKIIEKCRKDLFNLEVELTKAGKVDSANIINVIRLNAMGYQNIYDKYRAER